MKNVVTDFGADPTGTTDSTVAIQTAVDSTMGTLYFPTGTYICNGVTITNPYLSLLGEGKGATTIINNTNNIPTFSLANGWGYGRIIGMTLDRSVIAIAGGDGISSNNVTVNIIRFEELEILNNWCGFNLGCTGYSYLTNCFLHDNYQDGIRIANDNLNGSCQWTIKDTLCQTNNGCGLRIQATTYSMSVGEINNLSTFANAQAGIAVIGAPGVSVSGVRLQGGFIGADNGNGIYLDSYASFPHKLTGTVIESAGTAACGRSQSIPANNNSYGILITANNPGALLTGVICRANSYSGMYIGSGSVEVTGCDFSYNGQANAGGNRAGVYVGGGRLVATGNNMIGNQYGLILVTDNHIITSNNLSGNSSGAYYSGFGAFVKTQYANNLAT